MIENRYGFRRRVLNWLHGISPWFHCTKNFSLPFRTRRLRKRIEKIRLPVSRSENDPLFSSVEIETMNRCNGNCGFCPVNANQDPRPFQRMSTELFHRIIDELSAINFSGTVHLYSNNEAFLDTRIFDFAEYARGKLSSAKIDLSSNGTLLDVEKYKRIIKYLDSIWINNYCIDYKLKPNIAEIERYVARHPELSGKTHIQMRYERQIMTTRGGQAPNSPGRLKKPLHVGCLKPSEQLIIRPGGKTSLCCNDARGTVTLGYVHLDGLVKSWNNEPARDARRNVLRARTWFEICKGCDTM